MGPDVGEDQGDQRMNRRKVKVPSHDRHRVKVEEIKWAQRPGSRLRELGYGCKLTNLNYILDESEE